MKIRKLQLKNIGVFDDEEIEFKPCPAKDKAEIHILTGENGTGKTTILMALANIFNVELEDIIASKINIGLRGLYAFEMEVFRNNFYKRLRKQCGIKLELEHNQKSELFDFFYFPSQSNLRGDTFNKDSDIHHALFEISRLISQKNLSPHSIRFFPFAIAGYRRIRDVPIEIANEKIEEAKNPAYQALDFIKDENSKFNVNQWLGENLLNSSLAETRNRKKESDIFKEKIKQFEYVINEIIKNETKDNKIRFEMQSATKLVLIKNEQELDFDVLPDGLKSLISWIGDLLMRLDSLKWENDTPIFDREIILFLDEIEVHLHPAWQRKVLPIVQKLFKNAQIFVSTHSPFVVNSVDDAWVYKLKVEDGKAKVATIKKTENSQSITQVLREVFDIYGLFGKDVQDKIDKFEELRDKILSNGTNTKDEKELLKIAKSLYNEPSDQVKNIIKGELQQLSEIKGKEYSI
jgi:predicted ATP-binding protein involved in virulence